MGPGAQLRQIRDKLGISTREVESRSRQIAESEGNPEFAISHPWLTQIENDDAALTSLHKLFSLASIYGMSVPELLLVIGVDSQKVVIYHDLMPLPKTHLTRYQSLEESSAIELPVRFDASWNLNETHLLSRIVETWGRIPLTLLSRLDLRHRLYGYIGLRDYTLYPLIKPGSFVQIDPEIKKLKPAVGRSEFDRPIYFIDLRSEYACGWCEILGDKLLVVPHPLSPSKIRAFALPGEAEIVGQVTGVAMQIAISQDPTIAETSESSKQS